MGFEAFESVNAPCLAEVYANGLHKTGALPVHPDLSQPTLLKDQLCTDVFLLKLIPGTNPGCAQDADGNAVQGHCVGDLWLQAGMHFLRRNLLAGTAKADGPRRLHRGRSQCLYETSDFSLYEVGTRLLACGVIAGRDMTTEAGRHKAHVVAGPDQRSRRQCGGCSTPTMPARSRWHSVRFFAALKGECAWRLP